MFVIHFAIWVNFSADGILKYISYLSQKTEFDISCKVSPLMTTCTKCQNLFSGKNKKNITNLSSAEVAHMVKVKTDCCMKPRSAASDRMNQKCLSGSTLFAQVSRTDY